MHQNSDPQQIAELGQTSGPKESIIGPKSAKIVKSALAGFLELLDLKNEPPEGPSETNIIDFLVILGPPGTAKVMMPP